MKIISLEALLPEDDECLCALMDLGQVAKLLNIGLGKKQLMALLRQQSILLPNNSPSQRMINNGYMEYRIKEVDTTGGKTCVPVALVTLKGLKYLTKLFNKR